MNRFHGGTGSARPAAHPLAAHAPGARTCPLVGVYSVPIPKEDHIG